MKRTMIAATAIAALGAAGLAANIALADPGKVGQAGTDPVQLAHYSGGGAGMTGYGMGHGMMMNPGMMNMMMGGMGPAMMGAAGAPCTDAAGVAGGKDLTLEDAQKAAEQRVKWMGNERLKVGSVEKSGEDAYVAEIVTLDNSLVDKFEIDRKTGFMHPVR